MWLLFIFLFFLKKSLLSSFMQTSCKSLHWHQIYFKRCKPTKFGIVLILNIERPGPKPFIIHFMLCHGPRLLPDCHTFSAGNCSSDALTQRETRANSLWRTAWGNIMIHIYPTIHPNPKSLETWVCMNCMRKVSCTANLAKRLIWRPFAIWRLIVLFAIFDCIR